MINIMLDLETMSTASNAAIVAIGAVEFDIDGVSNEFYQAVNLQSCIDFGLTIDGSTVMWWLRQSEEARKALTDVKPLNLDDACFRFWKWCQRGQDSRLKTIQMWGNGAAFDNVILSNAFKSCGVRVPWMFWNDRCYRTIKNCYPELGPPEFEGTAHNALDDARFQARHLVAIANYAGFEL